MSSCTTKQGATRGTNPKIKAEAIVGLLDRKIPTKVRYITPSDIWSPYSNEGYAVFHRKSDKLMRIGVTPLEQAEKLQVTSTLNRANAIVYQRLGPGFSLPQDRVLLEPPEADTWNDIRRNVLFRMRIASTGQALAESTVNRINNIVLAINAELDGR